MNEQVSLAFSVQPSGYSSTSISIIPKKEDGSLNTEAIVSVNIASPVSGSPEAILIESISMALSDYRTAKGI
jgi:hypothetical protein